MRRTPVGQKVHPDRLPAGVKWIHVKDWQGRWYANRKDYTSLLHEDLQVRGLIMKRLADAGVSKVEIERSANQMTVIISAAKPGIVIGKSGRQGRGAAQAPGGGDRARRSASPSRRSASPRSTPCSWRAVSPSSSSGAWRSAAR